MKNFLADFNTRLEEINEYFSFVEFIDSLETHKKERLTRDSLVVYVPKRDLQKILRSNCYLLLYNLVESSIRNSILAVYDRIHDESLTFESLSEQIKEIWLNHQSKQMQLSEKGLKKWLKLVISEASTGFQIFLEKDTINISGNLDGVVA